MFGKDLIIEISTKVITQYLLQSEKYNQKHTPTAKYGYGSVIRLKIAIFGRHAHIHADKTDISGWSDS